MVRNSSRNRLKFSARGSIEYWLRYVHIICHYPAFRTEETSKIKKRETENPAFRDYFRIIGNRRKNHLMWLVIFDLNIGNDWQHSKPFPMAARHWQRGHTGSAVAKCECHRHYRHSLDPPFVCKVIFKTQFI